MCRLPGEAFRLPIAGARRLLVDDPQRLDVLHRYVRGSMADLMQRIACIRSHSSETRCACWLLKTAEQVGENMFELKHATLTTMLGVRPATVTDSLAELQHTPSSAIRRRTTRVDLRLDAPHEGR